MYLFRNASHKSFQFLETDKKKVIEGYLSKANLKTILRTKNGHEDLAKAIIRAMWTKFNEGNGTKDAKAAIKEGYIDKEDDFEKFKEVGKDNKELFWALEPVK